MITYVAALTAFLAFILADHFVYFALGMSKRRALQALRMGYGFRPHPGERRNLVTSVRIVPVFHTWTHQPGEGYMAGKPIPDQIRAGSTEELRMSVDLIINMERARC